MKKLLMSILAIGIMSATNESNALVGLVTLATGGTANVALAGLAVSGVGLVGIYSDGGKDQGPTKEFVNKMYIAMVIIPIGLLVLDGEKGQEVQFKSIPESELLKMNLTLNEARAFNDNTAELTEAFKVVQSELSKESKALDAAKLWNEQEAVLGSDTINGARKVVAFISKK